MNKLKYILIFAAGAAVGGCATWFGVKTYYEERTEHDIAEVKEYYSDMEERIKKELYGEFDPTKRPYVGLRHEIDRLLKEKAFEEHLQDDLDAQTLKKIVENYKPSTDDEDLPKRGFTARELAGLRDLTERPRIFDDYLFTSEDNLRLINAALMAESKAIEESTDKDELEDFDPLNPPPEDREPTVITEDEFCDDMSFEKQQITFYTLDDTLCDANDSIMDIDRTVGAESLSNIEPNTDMIYVRNYSLGIDYEIEIVNKSYTQYVLGIDPEDDGGFRQKSKRFDDEE